MVTHPVIGAISNMLWSFNSSSQGYIESIPQLQVCLTLYTAAADFQFGAFLEKQKIAKHIKQAFICQPALGDA